MGHPDFHSYGRAQSGVRVGMTPNKTAPIFRYLEQFPPWTEVSVPPSARIL